MKMKQRFISFLMVLALLVGILPASAFAAGGTSGTENGKIAEYVDKVADPSTQDVWNELVNSSSTKNVGRIWTDKTVAADNITLTHKLNASGGTTTPESETLTMNDDADFQVALSAMSSTMSSRGNAPLDIVLVLDASSSMSTNSMQGSNISRLEALKTAASNFVDHVADENKQILDSNNKHHVGLVTFNSYDSSKNNGNLKVELTSNTNEVRNEITAIKTTSGTRADLGLKTAEAHLDAEARPNAQKVVIFFTDGEPTAWGGTQDFGSFRNWVALASVYAASRMKQKGTTIYSIGVRDGLFPGTDPESYDDENHYFPLDDDVSPDYAYKLNGYLHAISSNYPDAAVDGITEAEIQAVSGAMDQGAYNSRKKPAGLRDSNPLQLRLGEGSPTRGYYKATQDANELNEIFDDIFTDITSATSPTYTQTGIAHSQTGYVTMQDFLGDYMEIKSLDAITIEGEVYTFNGTTTVDDTNSAYTDTTYTFTQSVSLKTVLAARQSGTAVGESLGAVKITERDYHDPASRDDLLVQIPISLLPLRYYRVENETLTIKETLPIRVVYSVGLLDEVRTALATGDYSQVNGLTDYIKNNTTDGQVHFYSNYWDGEDSNGDGRVDGNTYSTFSPAQTNPFYYYTEDTVFYKQVNGEYEPVTRSAGYSTDLAGTVYYKHTYYDSNGEKTEYVGVDIDAAINQIGSISWDNIANYIGINDDNQYFMKAGNAKLSLANDPAFINAKSENTTGTATIAMEPFWNENAAGGQYESYLTENYMGNNGRISFQGLGSLVVAKNVTHEANQTPNPNTQFHIRIALNNTADATYPATHSGNSEVTTLAFTNGVANVTLKANESILVEGLPAGTTYTVVETSAKLGEQELLTLEEGPKRAYTAAYNYSDESKTIAINETDRVVVNNTYEYTNVPVKVNFNLSGNKTLEVAEGSTYPGDQQTATFYLQYWHGNLDIGAGWVYVTEAGGTTTSTDNAVTATATYSNAGVQTINYNAVNTALAAWEYNEPGDYLFRIYEKNSGQTWHGVFPWVYAAIACVTFRCIPLFWQWAVHGRNCSYSIKTHGNYSRFWQGLQEEVLDFFHLRMAPRQQKSLPLGEGVFSAAAGQAPALCRGRRPRRPLPHLS